jgi:6,7-dimethyl-8-ribityllumazine synthase
MRAPAKRRKLSPALGSRLRIAIIQAEFNLEITESLERACVASLKASGIDGSRIELFKVPGCFEIPIMAQRLAQMQRFDALLALGAVIRGETFHFQLVAGECARGIMEVSLKYDVPIIFEVLAVYRRKDALRRARDDGMNKGIEAAAAAISLLGRLEEVG